MDADVAEAARAKALMTELRVDPMIVLSIAPRARSAGRRGRKRPSDRAEIKNSLAERTVSRVLELNEASELLPDGAYSCTDDKVNLRTRFQKERRWERS